MSITLETQPTLEETADTFEWSLTHRCDADRGVKGFRGAWEVAEQAYHRWTKDGQEILLCNHHNKKHQEALFVSGFSVEHHPYHDQLDRPLDINHVDGE